MNIYKRRKINGEEIRKMNIVYLKYAAAVAKAGSLSKAAEELAVAQPNLSRAIKELEKEYLRWHHYIIILNYVAGTKMLLFQYLA